MKKLLFILFLLPLISFGQVRNNLINQALFEDGKISGTFLDSHREYCPNGYSQSISDTFLHYTKKSLRIEYRKGDSCSVGKRSEIVDSVTHEQERWFGLSINPATGFNTPTDDGDIISQWHEYPDSGENFRSPPLSLSIKNNRYLFIIRADTNRINAPIGGSQSFMFYNAYDVGPVVPGQWVDWIFHFVCDYHIGGIGLTQVWANGILVLNISGPNVYNDAVYPYFKFGQYEPEVTTTNAPFNTRVVWFSSVRTGHANATYNDVAPGGISSILKITIPITGGTRASSTFFKLKYGKSDHVGFEVDDRLPHTHTMAAVFHGGYDSYSGQTFPGLTFTDGCGNPVNYRGGMAVIVTNDVDTTTDLENIFGSQYVKWKYIDTLIGWDYGLCSHGRQHNITGAFPGRTQNARACRQAIFDSTSFYGHPFYAQDWITPTADGYYPEVEGMFFRSAASTAPHGTQESPQNPTNYPAYPAQSYLHYGPVDSLIRGTRFIPQVRDFTFNNSRLADVNYFNSVFDNLVTLGTPSAPYEMRFFSHEIDSAQGFNAYFSHLKAVANDKVWVSSATELLDYLSAYQNMVKSEVFANGALTITLDTKYIPDANRWRDISLNISTDGVIGSAISWTGADNVTINPATGLVNVFSKKTTGFQNPNTLPFVTPNISLTLQKDWFYSNNPGMGDPSVLFDGDLNTYFNSHNGIAKSPDYLICETPDSLRFLLRQFLIRQKDFGTFANADSIYGERSVDGAWIFLGLYNNNLTGNNTWDTIKVAFPFVMNRVIVKAYGAGTRFGTEWKLIGDVSTWKEPTTFAQRPASPIERSFGVNTYPWDFMEVSPGSGSTGSVVPARGAVVARYPQHRIYWDRSLYHIHDGNTGYMFAPSTGWNLTKILQYDSSKGIDVLLDIINDLHFHTKTTLSAGAAAGANSITVTSSADLRPGYQIQVGNEYVYVSNSYTQGSTTVGLQSNLVSLHTAGTVVDFDNREGWPAGYPAHMARNYTANPLDTNSYSRLAEEVGQIAANYGSNKNLPNSYYKPFVWSGIAPDSSYLNQTALHGAAIIKNLFLEILNERDPAYFANVYATGDEIACMLQKCRTALNLTGDTIIKIVFPGNAIPDPMTLRMANGWVRQNLGYGPGHKLKVPWNIYNIHNYSTDGSAQYGGNNTQGLAPEISGVYAKDDAIVHILDKYNDGQECWLTEEGNDTARISAFAARPYGPYSPTDVQGMWTVRQGLGHEAHGIARQFFFQVYDPDAANPQVQFNTSGIHDLYPTMAPRAAADYIVQIIGAMKGYTRADTTAQYYHYTKAGANDFYVMWSPTMNNSTKSVTLNLPSGQSYTTHALIKGQSFTTNTSGTVGGSAGYSLSAGELVSILETGSIVITVNSNRLNVFRLRKIKVH